MFGRKLAYCLLFFAVMSAVSNPVRGQCTVEDFESFSVGDTITTQVPGVTFSVEPDTCPQDLFMRVVEPDNGTTSASQAIQIDTGCPDFSPDFVRMDFDRLQQEVTFSLGIGGGPFDIRAFAPDATPVFNETVDGGSNGVRTFIRVEAGGTEFIRVEIEGTISQFEAIDDLAFDQDDTPPTADITSPVGSPVSPAVCACGEVPVIGSACDEDGTYGMDMLEYRSAGSDAWTTVGSFFSPLCGGGTLYVWDTEPVSEGYYNLRLTVENGCQLRSTDFTTVYVDKHFGLTEEDWRKPNEGDIVGGNVCLDGTVYDRCFESYEVDFRSADGGKFLPVDPGNPVYDSTVVNDPFASWSSEVAPDGDYELRVLGLDTCNNTSELIRTVTVDNTNPTAEITQPADCASVEGDVEIIGTADDAHLAAWTVSYVGGDADSWTTIASGNTAVVDDTLAVWDTSGLPACAYVVRLRVRDEAKVNCESRNNVSDYYLPVLVGDFSDFDADNDGDVDLADYSAFVDAFTGVLP